MGLRGVLLVHGLALSVGWLAPGDNLSGDRNGTPKPAWALGPASAVTMEMKMRGCR